MAETYTDQLNSILERAAEEKCFSLDTIKRINELREQFAAIVTESGRKDEQIKTMNEANGALRLENARLDMDNKNWLSLSLKKADLDHREELLVLKEKQATGERDLAIDMFKTVFTNATLRKRVFESIPGHTADNGQYICGYDKSRTEEVEER
jgi:hypothetical protein